MASRRSSTGLLLLGSAGPTPAVVSPFLDRVGLVVAADSGFDLAVELEIEPDLVVGDLDSVTRIAELARLPAHRVRRADRDKALTDAELGLQVLTGRGCTRIIVAGGGGGRFDHQLAVLGLFERDPRLQVWLTEAEHMEVIEGCAHFRGHLGCTVSLFPLSGTAEGLASCGLRWPLDGIRLRRGYASVSNVVVANDWQVAVETGRLLMIRNLGRLPVPP